MSPHLSITSQWEQTTARHNVVVFNAAACSDWTRLHKWCPNSPNRFSPAEIRFSVPMSPLDLDCGPSGFGFYFRLAETQDLLRILHRFTVFIVEIHR